MVVNYNYDYSYDYHNDCSYDYGDEHYASRNSEL